LQNLFIITIIFDFAWKLFFIFKACLFESGTEKTVQINTMEMVLPIVFQKFNKMDLEDDLPQDYLKSNWQ
jgi:hypothetical protein